MADSFDLSAVAAALSATAFADRVQHLPSIGSTNVLALEAAQAGAPHGSVWIADEQTAGRGRGGHGWYSIPGDGLYLSVLLRPQMALADALWLSLATGLAAQSAIAAVTGIKVDIRWPNDLLIKEKKCGGILVETSTGASHSEAPAMLRYAVIGIGLNVNHQNFPDELQSAATSLRREDGRPWSRQTILIELLLALETQISLLEEELREVSNTAGLLERFTVASSWVCGKRVRVEEAGGYTGVTTGLDARGFLRVAGDDGKLHTVLSGGVRPY
ncbi:biotin--[acetyl-CoA-carboxylase] ligase [Granulicella sp. S190]|uniref:biotin--[acetyl-CoA-carboxylase] ligase n=1 Tax=Granulicella sp. S190 TaxID=1747226 RepID=UPI0020B14BDA|nr:biotin--[acetyl-CoA-carboxylase] ligase [Granulicella sp. S190]